MYSIWNSFSDLFTNYKHRNEDTDNNEHLEIRKLLRSQFERHQGNAIFTHC